MTTATNTDTLPSGAEAAIYQDGVYLVGEFLGLRDGRERSYESQGETIKHTPCDVRLLMGASVTSVQFDTRQDAERAIGGAQERDRIMVRAFNRYGVKAGRVWQFYAGPRGRGDDAA